MVAVGLGFVIFVHELGHFLVAKLCGVRCEKFYLGFDIAGLRFCKFRWGETEYGIGILPLGGYVKMLGQEDNPARLQEEIERAKQGAHPPAEGQALSSPAGRGNGGAGSQTPPANTESPASNPALYDPRSFLAQSVPKRMAIISAGVIMNVIFAFLMAMVAFYMGVEQSPCVIGQVVPGDPAWQADLRPGDRILDIAGKRMKQFRDLIATISLGDIDAEKGVPVVVERPGVKQPLSITVKPDHSRGKFIIGVVPAYTTQLATDRKTWLEQNHHAAIPGSVAALTKPAFHTGDRIVQIDEVPIENAAQIGFELTRRAGRKIAVTVERAEEEAAGQPTGKSRRLVIEVPPSPMRTLGLVMKMGEITALQARSPAVAAGLRPGDLILQVDSKPVADPLRLPEELNKMAGKTVKLSIRRDEKTLVVPIQAREPYEFSPPDIADSPVEIPSLGIAYRVLNEVDRVIAGSPAAAAGLAAGDVLLRAKLLPPDKEVLRKLEFEQAVVDIPFTETNHNWPFLLRRLQVKLPDTRVELVVSRSEKERTVVLNPVEARDWLDPDRGFLFEPMSFERKAENFGEACALGGRETLDELTFVFRTLRAIGTSQVSPRNLGGPWMIIKTALAYADQGTAVFLMFLTMLSANLAVLNILPIPVLDGGHLVFLAYEGIRGKPANERVQVVLTYMGLIFIIGLMVWVCGLDFGFISRR
jgi:regulator of sigma E protease